MRLKQERHSWLSAGSRDEAKYACLKAISYGVRSPTSTFPQGQIHKSPFHLFLDAALQTVAYLRVSARSQDLAK